jgi:uncharacterized membrane protein
MISLLSNIEDATRARWLLLGSLALNLFFVGAAGAVAIRYSSAVPLSAVAHINLGATDLLDRLAATLPSTDAQLMRTELRADERKVASAQADLRLSQEELRQTLRADPFDLEAMRAAMAKARQAQENLTQTAHEVVAAAAVKMSVVGRNKIADWPSAPSERAKAKPQP